MTSFILNLLTRIARGLCRLLYCSLLDVLIFLIESLGKLLLWLWLLLNGARK